LCLFVFISNHLPLLPAILIKRIYWKKYAHNSIRLCVCDKKQASFPLKSSNDLCIRNNNQLIVKHQRQSNFSALPAVFKCLMHLNEMFTFLAFDKHSNNMSSSIYTHTHISHSYQ